MQRAMARNPGGASGSDHGTASPLGPMDAYLSCLWWFTPITATLSVLVVIIAMLTNQWLHTEEKMNNPSYNGTGEKDYLSKLTISGLWMLCFTNRIGREIAKQLLACGAQVIAVGLGEKHLESLKNEAPAIKTIELDLSDWNKTETILSQEGPLDLLVNNAGIAIFKPMTEVTEDDVNNILNVNIKAVINITQMFVKQLLERKAGGAIVSVSSIGSAAGLYGHSVYCASKAAIDSFSRSIALSLGLHDIRVNFVNPTAVLTDMGKQLDWANPKYSKPLFDKTPLGRFAEVNEVVDAVLYLLSDRATMVTAGEELYDCNKIDYFTQEEYSPDPGDSTMAIPYTVTRSVVFFMISILLLFSGYGCAMYAQCGRHRTLCIFLTGIIFLVAGLVMLFGLIMYISVFKAEIGSKLRPRSQLQPPAFSYWYGYSFVLYVSGLVASQLAAVCALSFFFSKIKHDARLETFNKGKSPNPSSNLTYTHYEPAVYYPCRRHPQAYVNSNSAIHFPAHYPSPTEGQKRYCFSKEPLQDSPCSIHRPTSNSIKDMSNFYDFPPLPSISYQFEHLERTRFPRDITTNTVSTTADVNCDDIFPDPYDDYSPSIHHDNFVGFNLDQPLPLRAQSVVSIASRNNGNSLPPTIGSVRKTFDSDTLRRTTPV